MSKAMTSIWLAAHPPEEYASLDRDLSVDVAVIGGGISGLTAAVLLTRAGCRVAVIESNRIGHGETGQTTSHLTEAVDSRYHSIITDFNEDVARLVAQSSREAIDCVERLTRELSLDDGFERMTGYLYCERESDLESLAQELDAALRAGCNVEWTDIVPLPFETLGGIAWRGQARVDPIAYLNGLAREAAARGAIILEQTRALEVSDGEPCTVKTSSHAIQARAVFVATNVPINNRVFLHTKIAAYRSYAVAAEYPGGDLPGLFWDTDDPYHYTRTHRLDDRTYLIVGGEDHRTGEEGDTVARYERLIRYARKRFGPLTFDHRWSGQIIEPVDGLPYIGTNTASAHVYVATGYSGNGITFGTLAGLIVSARILGNQSPYADVYDATRVKPIASAVNYVTENVAFPIHLLADRLTRLDTTDTPPQDLSRGDGGIFSLDDGKVAVCRDRSGAFHAVSAVCTHLACDVKWNKAEQTWDCPCHGSRFSPEGRVINGPAVRDLKAVELPTAKSTR